MVIESVLFGLVFAIAIGVADVASASLTRRLGVLRTVFLLQLIAVFGTTAFALATSQLSGLRVSHLLIMGGLTVLIMAFYLAFYRALQLGPIALVSPIVAAHSVVVVVLAMTILGESISAWQLSAIAAVVAGVAMAAVDWKAVGSGRSIMSVGVGLAVVVSLVAGFWQFTIAALSRELGWFVPVYLSRLFMVGLLVPVVVARREWPWRRLGLGLAAAVTAVAILETLAMFAFTRGAEIGIVSIVAAASTAYPVVPIVGGIVLFKERLSRLQFAGLFVAIVGLASLSLLP